MKKNQLNDLDIVTSDFNTQFNAIIKKSTYESLRLLTNKPFREKIRIMIKMNECKRIQ